MLLSFTILHCESIFINLSTFNFKHLANRLITSTAGFICLATNDIVFLEYIISYLNSIY